MMPSTVRVKFKVNYDQWKKGEYTDLPEELVAQEQFQGKVILNPSEAEAPIPKAKKGK